MNETVKFFLGANSDKGFISYFGQLQEQTDFLQLLILKGGPGSGKSSLMKRVCSYAAEKGHEIELIPCASDPDSLDAFIDRTTGFAMMDGTAPHVEDPLFPGAKQHIMYTGSIWDNSKLRKKYEEIEFFSKITGEYHKSATAYIKAAGALLGENLRISYEHTDRMKTAQFAQNAVVFPKGSSTRLEKRLLSAVSVGELTFFGETLSAIADKVYLIEDEWGGVAESIFENIVSLARLNGLSVIVCPCSIMPEKTDHIILPDVRVAFSLGNRFMKCRAGEIIKTDAFYKDGIDISLCTRRSQDAQKLLTKAQTLIKAAKKSHDVLEKFYVNAADFSKMEGFFKEITEKFYDN